MARAGNKTRALAILRALLWLVLVTQADAAELKKRTVEAFDRYIQLTEARMEKEIKGDANSFLWVDHFPEPHRQNLYLQLRQGHIFIDRLETRDAGRHIKVPDGLIHHWVAVSFIPGATLKQTLAVMRDYDNHYKTYKFDVQRSKLLSADGNDFKVYMRLYKKSIVTAVFNAEFDVRYFHIDSSRAYSRSYSTRIAEVENPGQPGEREKPIGRDSGYLWKLYSYWRFQEKDGGVYVQTESIGISRTVPLMFAWLVNPLLKSIPREHLTRVMDSLRTAVINRSPPTSRTADS